jgi:hypothetical protein
VKVAPRQIVVALLGEIYQRGVTNVGHKLVASELAGSFHRKLVFPQPLSGWSDLPPENSAKEN